MLATETLTESRRLLDRARLIAEAPASQASQIGHGHPSSKPPAGVVFTSTTVTHAPSTLDTFGQVINLAISHDSDMELRAANRWCVAELESLQHGSVVVPETIAERRARRAKQYVGVIAPTVAACECCSVTEVRKDREALGLTARLGHKRIAEPQVDVLTGRTL